MIDFFRSILKQTVSVDHHVYLSNPQRVVLPRYTRNRAVIHIYIIKHQNLEGY